MAEDLELWDFVEGYERIYRVIISRYKCIANKTRSITSGPVVWHLAMVSEPRLSFEST